MDNLKLISIRVSTSSLDSAQGLAKKLGGYNPSDIFRLVIWIGFKIANPRCVSALFSLMIREQAGIRAVTVDDVLRAAGVVEDER